jgi:hypothetical protein
MDPMGLVIKRGNGKSRTFLGDLANMPAYIKWGLVFMGKMLRTQQQCCCELVPRIESSVRETAVPSICKMIKTPSEYPSAPAGGLSSFGIPSDKRT